MNRSKAAAVLLGVLIAATLTSCNVDVDHPVADKKGCKVDPAPYLGEWIITAVRGRTRETIDRLTISLEGTNLLVRMGEPASRLAYAMQVTRVGTNVIASVKESPDALATEWTCYRVDLDDNGNRMMLSCLDEAQLSHDIGDKIIGGDVKEKGKGGALSPKVAATSEELRAYLEARPAVFRSDTICEFISGATTGDSVAIANNMKKSEGTIQVNSLGTSDLTVIPEELRSTAPVFSLGKPDLPVPLIVLRSQSGCRFAILGIDVPDPRITARYKALRAGGYRIELAGMEFFDDFAGKSMVIRTDHPLGERIEIPFVDGGPKTSR